MAEVEGPTPQIVRLETPGMPEPYHKARRQLGLYSALLLAWEYIGIKVGDEIETPGFKTKVAVNNPEVIPVLLFILVLYFTFRITIEWFQCSQSQRENRVTLIDVVVSYLLALVAILVYLYQLTGHRIAETITTVGATYYISGQIIGSIGLCFIVYSMFRLVRISYSVIMLIIIFFIITLLPTFLLYMKFSILFFVALLVLGLFSLVCVRIKRYWNWARMREENSRSR